MKLLRVVILSGISYSGKSTYVKKFLLNNSNYVCICPDTVRKNVTGSESDMSRDGFIWGKMIPEMFELAKSNGQNILFDATMLNSKARKPIVKLAKNCGFVVDCHYFVPNLDLVKERLKLRERQVPMEVILSQVSRWQEPSFDEGFDILFNLSKI